MPETPIEPNPQDPGLELRLLLEKLSGSLKPVSMSGSVLLKDQELERTEEARLQLRRDCKNNLYFLTRAILGYKDLVQSVHLPVCNFLINQVSRNKLLELPRGHFKSTCGSIGLPVWLQIQCLFGLTWNSLSPTRLHLLLRVNTAENAELFLQEIRNQWDTNALLRWTFPELVPQGGDKWTNERIWVTRQVVRLEDGVAVNLDFRADALGTGGSATSRHYDAVIDDDLVDEDEADSETQMEKVIREHRRSESLFAETSVGRHWLIGTRWAYHDLISHVKKTEPDVDAYRRPATENGIPIFPERFSMAELARIKRKQGPYIYSCFYELNPVPEEEQLFRPEWIRTWDKLPPGLRIVFCADPAISLKAGSDYSGITGIGVTPRGEDGGYDIYVIHAKRQRMQPNDLIHEMYELTQVWKPALFGFEDIGFQRAFQYPIRLLQSQYPVSIPLAMVKWPRQASKEVRIRSLQPYFANGQIYVSPDMADLYSELTQFPHGEHDDIIDALAYAVFLANPHGDASVENIFPEDEGDWSWVDGLVGGRLEPKAQAIFTELNKRHAAVTINELAERAFRGF